MSTPLIRDQEKLERLRQELARQEQDDYAAFVTRNGEELRAQVEDALRERTPLRIDAYNHGLIDEILDALP